MSATRTNAVGITALSQHRSKPVRVAHIGESAQVWADFFSLVRECEERWEPADDPDRPTFGKVYGMVARDTEGLVAYVGDEPVAIGMASPGEWRCRPALLVEGVYLRRRSQAYVLRELLAVGEWLAKEMGLKQVIFDSSNHTMPRLAKRLGFSEVATVYRKEIGP